MSEHDDLVPDELKERLERAKNRWRVFKAKERAALRDKASLIKELLDLRQDRGRLPDRTLEEVLPKLEIKSPQTLINKMNRCAEFESFFPDEPLIYALINTAGAEVKKVLTDEQEIIVVGSYLYTRWETLLVSGKTVKKKRVRVTVEHVYDLLKKMYPNLEATLDQVERFIEREEANDGGLFTLAREGAKKFWERYAPKLPNDAIEPGQLCMSDGRGLPWFVKYRNQICTVTLVTLVDAFTGCIVKWALVPRREEDAEGKVKKTDFKSIDIRILIAELFLDGDSFDIFYTDHGGQYKAIIRLLKILFGDSHRFKTVLGFPGHPWGRGLTEVIQFIIDGLFSVGIPGFYIEDEGWSALTAAQHKDELLDFSDAVLEVDKYVKDWNNKVLANGKTRAQVYREHPRVKTISIPTERLALLAAADDWAQATISDLGILYKKVYYKPHIASEADYIRWSNAAGNALPIPICVIHTSEGRLVLACFDGLTWEYVFRVSDQRISPKKRFAYQKATENAKRDELQKRIDAFLKLLDEKLGGIPKFQHGEAILPASASQPEPEQVAQAATTNNQQPELVESLADSAIPQEVTDNPPSEPLDVRAVGDSQPVFVDTAPTATVPTASETESSKAKAGQRAKRSGASKSRGTGQQKDSRSAADTSSQISIPPPASGAPANPDPVNTHGDQSPRISSAERMRQLREEQARKRQSNQ